MTNVYFVRHAEPDFTVKDDLTRPLSKRGIDDIKKVTDFLKDKNIDKIFSSPYKRTIDTIKDFSETKDLEIVAIDDLRERKVDDVWIEDFNSFAKNQWNDFEYKLTNGECLREVQERNVAALHNILKENNDKNIVIGTHGTALSTIINYYNQEFGHAQFERIKYLMPYIVCMKFEETDFKGIQEFVI